MKYNIIDMHAHIFPDKVAERAVASIGQYYGVPMVGGGTIQGLLESGKKINVHKYVVHSTATRIEQVNTINGFIADAKSANPSFIGFGTLHPRMEYGDIQTEVERIISLGLMGIKLHPEFQDFYIDDERALAIYEAIEGKLPLLIHMGDENKTSSSPERLAKIMDMFPNLIIIAAHLGGYRMWRESMSYLVGRNLYLDTSSSLWFLDKEKAVEIIRKHGVKKVVFGTDYPMWNHVDEMERFNRLGLTEDEKALILWKNAERLLKLKL